LEITNLSTGLADENEVDFRRVLDGRARARALTAAPWFILVVGPGWMFLVSRSAPQLAQTVLTISLAAFFLLLTTRLVLAARDQPERRSALVLLVAGVLLFAAGSSVLNGSGNPDLTQFPAPGEWLFLASYLAMAGYLLLDTSRRATAAGGTWLEAAVICGGTACLAGAGVLAVATHYVGREGLPLLLALLYPMIDIVLGLLVVAQVALRTRGPVLRSGGLLVGFALMATADSGFLLHLSTGTYDYSILSVDLWGAAFALIVGNACRMRTEADVAVPPTRGLSTLVVAAGMAAAIVLAFEPEGTIRTYLLLPALATLTAAGARLVLAVRAANRAADAIALSHSDDLTNLPNRRAVIARLDKDLGTIAPVGLMILDLNGFKDVNDTLGHGAGDVVLCEIAARMRARLPADVMIARLGGDEFAVIAGTENEIELMEIAQEILLAVRSQLVVDGIALSADASIGITTRQAHDVQSTEMLRRADVAMYAAKEQRAGAVVYDPDTDDFSRERLRLGDELRRAIEDEQLVLWYQPQIDAGSGHVCGLEGLVRWRHPTYGLMSPAEFLPAARRAGLMQALSEEIGRIAVADLQKWRRRGVDVRVAINCAPPELMSDIFIPRLSDMLADADLSPSSVVIEVTEDSFLAEPERARAVLLDVRARGFQISVDDYGTGFSSLSYLRDLPIQELKIDRSFVAAMCTDERSRMIVASTLQMAHALDLRTVAEGVEDAATCAELVALGVDVLQGYHLARPVPPEQVVPVAHQTYAVARPLRLAESETA
jgi:diguanylate cyclase